MRTPLDFFVKFRHLLLFIVLEAVCMSLIYRHNSNRDNVVFTTAGNVAGVFCNISSSVSEYFGLRVENRKLADENAFLRSQLYLVRDSVEVARLEALTSSDSILVGRVISNTINRNQNYITVDIGSVEGVAQGMPVYASEGVVGVVYRVSRHFSLVMPLLNTSSSISCRIRGADCFGFLRWNGGDIYHASLTDLPSRSGVFIGDTVETSGFSKSFQSGLMVGIVSDIEESEGVSPEVTVNLAVDFSRIGYVYIETTAVPQELLELTSM